MDLSYSYSSATVPLSSCARGWVDRISNIFRKEIAVDIDHLPPVSVFEVPKTLSLKKPEAYTPQLIAMGPYHHLRPELYQMERYKLAAIKEISTPEQISNFQHIVINRLKEIDPSIRACYNKFMDYDQDTLAWIIAIDGCFFLHILHSYLRFASLFKSPNSNDQGVEGPAVSGCLVNGPIQLVPTYTEFRNSSTSSSSSFSTDNEDPEVAHNNLETLLDLVETIGPKHTQRFLSPVKFVSSIPWSTISGLYRKGNLGTGEQNSEHDEIEIPSVSHLWRYAKVQCKPFIGSIQEIKFVEEEAALYLPVMNLNASSEVIMRNLVAYEAAMCKSTLKFARYVNLMNGIIDTAEDVKLLKQNGVIKGVLTDGEIADQFNGMQRCYAGSDHKSNIEVAVEKVNKFYGKKLLIRTVRGLKKNLYASWKCLALVSTVVLLVVLSLQTFCEFYQCSKIWNFHQEPS
nr:putative UPF0481 protein At3g02645 [Coffea arabica]